MNVKSRPVNEVEVSIQSDGAKVEYRRRLLTVGEYLKLKPSKAQDGNGKAIVKASRVANYQSAIKEALTIPTGPIVYLVNGTLVQGHTRQAAAELENAKGTLDSKFEFPTIEILTPLTPEQLSKLTILGNIVARDNWRTMAVRSELPISKKMIKPIFDEIISVSSDFPINLAQDMAPRLAALVNHNEAFISAIRDGRPIKDVQGYDLYNSKGLLENSEYFFRAEPRVDLRQHRSHLRRLIRPATQLVGSLKRSGTWRDQLGNSKTFVYPLYALSLQGTLTADSLRDADKVTVNSVITKVKTRGRKLKRLATEYNGDPVGKDSAMVAMLLGDKDL